MRRNRCGKPEGSAMTTDGGVQRAAATSGPRLGLALGSGSARGWAHIGVIHALAERGLRPAVVAGASVGALVSAAYASGRLQALEDWVCTLTQLDVWRLVDATFLGGGVMSGNRLMAAICARIGDSRIEELPVAFGAVATDLYTGEEIWLRAGPAMQAVRASSGLPGLFAPTWYQDRWLVDGGMVNPVPVSLCRALGAEIVIAVDLSRSVTRPGLRPDVHNVPPAAPAAANGEGNAILKRWSGLVDGLVESFRSKRDEPGLFEVMTSSVNIMQDRITRSRLALDAPDLVLHPELHDFQLMDFHRARAAIAAGRACVEQAASRLAPFAGQS
jgi:NTE family protein